MVRILVLASLYLGILENIASIFTYFDEVIAFFLLCYIFIYLMSQKNKLYFNSIEKLILLLTIIFSIFSVISSIISTYENTFFLQAYTLFGDIKFIIYYFGFKLLFRNYKINDKHALFFLRQTYLFMIVFVSLYIVNIPLNFMETYSYRFGLENISYGYDHPAVFSTIVILQLSINLYFTAIIYKKINYFYIIGSLFLLLTSGRVISIGFLALLFVLVMSYRYLRRYVFNGALISALVLLLVGFEKLKETFISDTQPRGILLHTSIRIAQDIFPFGSGLGTFGSNASRINYSSVYYNYGISDSFGLSPVFGAYLTDSYWAMIIGEIGFIGALTIVVILILMFLNFYNQSKNIFGIMTITPMLYLIVSSPVDTILVSNSVCYIMIILCFLWSINKQEISKKNNKLLGEMRSA
ncbi:hypothetical protein [Terribacillus halophilus]|uniref:hypothetical protein n=1 Tax=Terribacillus halophilus TaxID=361279 RepID=UPI003981A7E4